MIDNRVAKLQYSMPSVNGVVRSVKYGVIVPGNRWGGLASVGYGDGGDSRAS